VFWYLDHFGIGVNARKFGERPRFGAPPPPSVRKLIGNDDLILKGLRAEQHGLGLGAFVYYRRVVENHSRHLFEALEQAARHLGDDEAVDMLHAASACHQFSRAVELVKDRLPRRLWIENRNPLTLLHGALSNDIHAATDDECLEIATSIRTVLIEMGERLADIMADKTELKKAVSTLHNKPKR
jgi:hypothetical protein